MPTLILSPRYTADAQALWKAAIALGWGVERLVRWQVSAQQRSVLEPVLYLEGLMAPTIAEAFGLELLTPSEDWLPQLPAEYRQRSVELTTLGQARSLTQRAFIKPPNDKSFPAAVYTGSELPHSYPEETPVLVADIVAWEKEFRCFILNRTIQTFSVYLRKGKLQHDQGFAHTPDEAQALMEFVDVLLQDSRVPMPMATVIDVGRIPGKGWAVVEQNAAWGSGIYGCEPQAVLKVLRYAAIPSKPQNPAD